MTELSGRVFAVTGASGGMGRVICRMLAEAGGKLALTSNDRAAMNELKKELPPDTLTEILDITKEEEVSAFFGKIGEAYGHADALLNLAGLSIPAKIGEMEETDYCQQALYPDRGKERPDHQYRLHGGAARERKRAALLYGESVCEYVLIRAADTGRACRDPGNGAQSRRGRYAVLGKPESGAGKTAEAGSGGGGDPFCADL